jgi:adenine-specific DNA-methyltransferase
MPLLSWANRDADLTRAALAPYRLLEPVANLSHGDPESPNMLIEGDNLDALKALLPYYAGQVKCVFIDPPYNTKSAFEHYDDNLEHSQWLSMMYPRLELLRELLAEDGSLWVTLDDNEAHYFKVIADEVFGRPNFLLDMTWHRKISPANDAKHFSNDNDHLFVYAKSSDGLAINRLERNERNNSVFKNPDNDSRGAWNSVTLTGNKTKEERPNLYFKVVGPQGQEVWPPDGLTWRSSPDTYAQMAANGLIYWGKDGTSRSPRIKRFASEAKPVIPRSLWHYGDVGHTQEAMLESKKMFGQEAFFGTPKPERLVKRILEIATNPGDLVLDSFLGSGTTAAVAHKMGRRWIGIEMGEHARTHCQPRIVKVVDGEQGGISESVGWNGGGGFRFFKLGVPVFDEDGRIDASIRFEHLAAHVWFAETGTPRSSRAKKAPFLGEHKGIGYYLLFNGILGDERKDTGNVLTRRVLRSLPAFDGPKVIYGEACALTEEQLRELDITFRQTPYDIRGR